MTKRHARRALVAGILLIATAASATDEHCLYKGNCPFENRQRLLAMPDWMLAGKAEQKNEGRLVRFEQRGEKLVAIIDTGPWCESDVEFTAGGFVLEMCPGSRRFEQVDDAYRSFDGAYVLTLRQPR